MYGHQKITKIYERFKRQFDFLRAKTAIINIVKDCKVYVRTKASQYKSYGEFQVLPMPERAWGSVTINFIVKLPKSRDLVNNTSYNSIFVIVDRLTKYGKFTSANESHLIEDLVDIVV